MKFNVLDKYFHISMQKNIKTKNIFTWHTILICFMSRNNLIYNNFEKKIFLKVYISYKLSLFKRGALIRGGAINAGNTVIKIPVPRMLLDQTGWESICTNFFLNLRSDQSVHGHI